jgi:hypothetical protein
VIATGSLGERAYKQFAAGLTPHAVADKYYVARRPEVTRMVDISAQIDKKVEANRANNAKGPARHLGSRLRAELAKKEQRLPVLGDGDDLSTDRNYIRDSACTAAVSQTPPRSG